ncbi:MAG: aminoacyl-tRNA hydrolase [Chlamydiia bacterium]|nr:aminoacyl-tRNA hydrolase [Chlamydiia bacterium]MCB1115075.1 aminoacyl-tRNA hydrolase [Chlamydiia bacterium]
MESESQKVLIVGLGNPGKKYEKTRHNLGQMVLDAFAQKLSFSFKKERDLKGEVAKGMWKEKKVFLLFPTTYMNLSGEAVLKTMQFYKIELDRILILSDDVALPFGSLRYRKRGSSGGHNGLKDIERCLGTQDYHRLKLGIGEPALIPLDEYVLAPFTKEEQEKIPEMTTQALNLIEEWTFQEMKEHA